jgi:hypothetical protein
MLPTLPALEGIDLRITAAATPRSLWISGWSVSGPLASRRYLPQSSVLFVEAKSELSPETLAERLLQTFWYQPALVPEPAVDDPLEFHLDARCGMGYTLLGVICNAN